MKRRNDYLTRKDEEDKQNKISRRQLLQRLGILGGATIALGTVAVITDLANRPKTRETFSTIKLNFEGDFDADSIEIITKAANKYVEFYKTDLKEITIRKEDLSAKARDNITVLEESNRGFITLNSNSFLNPKNAKIGRELWNTILHAMTHATHGEIKTGFGTGTIIKADGNIIQGTEGLSIKLANQRVGFWPIEEGFAEVLAELLDKGLLQITPNKAKI